VVTAVIDGAGTAESFWRPWLAQRTWPRLDLAALVLGRRVVVLAAHPDDEVLGVGGMLRRLAAGGASIVVVWATDGEASHPGTKALTPSHLATRRRAESLAALEKLGVMPIHTHHLGLPDSGLSADRPRLVAALREIIDDHDLVLAPWRGDGHPDHEAVGEAAAILAATLIEYPIWMWHWAAPGDARVPWHRVRSVDAVDLAAKSAAINAFDTQVRPLGPDPADAAVLSPHVLERFQRPDELVFK
jgi:LmbE family N-acetylglucosaminyl deacetylase